jgi:hypothetical protein
MPDATIPADVLSFFMALPFFADSTPRAYRLKTGNADLAISTRSGTFPGVVPLGSAALIFVWWRWPKIKELPFAFSL